MKIWLVYLTLLMLVLPYSGSTADKHPRVAELEDKLLEDATKQLKSRFPEIPFILNVNVEPLRRGLDRDVTSNDDGERLPYLEVDESEIRDEWDNPKATLYSLSARVVRMTVAITVPATLSEAEISDIQDVLNQSMRLIPGRDVIQVRKQNWSYGNGFDPQIVYLASGIGLLVFLIGLFIVSRLFVRRLASAIGELQSSEIKDSGAAMLAAPPISKSVGKGSREPLVNGGGSGELTVTDPVKMREVIQSRLQMFISQSGFPTLRDLMLMDDYARATPKSLGALISALPEETKKELFSLTPGPHWFEAFAEPGAIDGKVMEIIERLAQVRSNTNDREFELLLIQIWRMGEKRNVFIKDLGSEEGLIMLSYLPKSIAIPTGRAVFPGGWGGLLEHGYQWISFPPARIKELFELTLKEAPRHDYDELEKYLSDKDLVAYMRVADMDLERDVYEALDDNSLVVQLRAPFYVIFEASNEVLEALVPKVTIDDWALALFNVPRLLRANVEGQFTPKQLFLFKEKMKSLDENPPLDSDVGACREDVGRVFREVHLQMELQKNRNLTRGEGTDSDSENEKNVLSDIGVSSKKESSDDNQKVA